MIINWDFIIRIVVAAILGGAIGVEREYHAKDAGFRTHLLVAIGSALFTVISMYGFDSFLGGKSISFDPSRIAAQIVTGIGFLGAGTIIFQKQFIRGLTTAAGLWVTAAIGLACGCGMYFIALLTTALVLICLATMNIFIKRISTRHISISFSCNSQEEIKNIISALKNEEIEIKDYSMQQTDRIESDKYIVSLNLKTKRYHYKDTLFNLIQSFEGINIVSFD